MEKAITRGHLTVADSEGVHHFGTRSKGCNDVYLKVVSSDFWMRVLLYVPFTYSLYPVLIILQFSRSGL
jgi:hypothetical protein